MLGGRAQISHSNVRVARRARKDRDPILGLRPRRTLIITRGRRKGPPWVLRPLTRTAASPADRPGGAAAPPAFVDSRSVVRKALALLQQAGRLNLLRPEALAPERPARQASAGVATAVLACSPLRAVSSGMQVRKGARAA
ncbi:hypothetical protein NDU88_007385 [Pleurodeles waltl]|uniref:Uncharacterized protein n=1 Tax=Pleurodeles waltl TaxID=8319 RepID=A0AAV7PME6_PLEWA|nr:hypothetical protein NDU88_007385 [Pleurodeles waltl]